MCTCIQKSKKPAGAPGNFNYVFKCTKGDGSKVEIKITAGNDNEAKQLAELECGESNIDSHLKYLRKLNSDIRGEFYLGRKFADNNFPGHILLISNNNNIYSFNENDVLKESVLPDGKVYLKVRSGSSAYLSSPFIVGNKDVDFLNIADNLINADFTQREDAPRLPTKIDFDKLLFDKPLARTLPSVAANYRDSCVLSDVEGNNCAHYLSNAFINAGFTELKKVNKNPLITLWCDWNDTVKNDNARPVRALDMKNWFNSMATKKERTIQNNNGFWAVYQESQADGQGHVLIYDSNNKIVYGTKDRNTGQPYFFNTWLQFFYQW